MSRLKKLVLLSIVLFLIIPVVIMLYSVLLFGNAPTDSQWVSASAIVLSSLGIVIMVIVSLEMR